MDPLDRVKDLVRRALATNPKVSNKELMQRAKEVAPTAVEGLTLQQFHARFRLPVLRHEMQPRPKESEPRLRRRRPKAPAVGVPEPGITLAAELREILVRFGVDLEAATSRSELVRVVGGIDGYVSEILAAAQKHLGGNGKPDVRAATTRVESAAAGETNGAEATGAKEEAGKARPAPTDESLRTAFREWRDEGSRRAMPGTGPRTEPIARIPWSAPTARGGPQG